MIFCAATGLGETKGPKRTSSQSWKTVQQTVRRRALQWCVVSRPPRGTLAWDHRCPRVPCSISGVLEIHATRHAVEGRGTGPNGPRRPLFGCWSGFSTLASDPPLVCAPSALHGDQGFGSDETGDPPLRRPHVCFRPRLFSGQYGPIPNLHLPLALRPLAHRTRAKLPALAA